MDRSKAMDIVDEFHNNNTDPVKECSRCQNDAEHRVELSSDRDDAPAHVRKLCNDCLRELGKWWRNDL